MPSDQTPYKRQPDQLDQKELPKSKNYLWNFLKLTHFSVKKSFLQKLWEILTAHKRTLIPSVALALIILILIPTLPLDPEIKQGVRRTPLLSFGTGILIESVHAQDNFTLQPTQSDSAGIDPQAEFVLSSKQDLDPEEIQKYLVIQPETDYEMTKTKPGEYKIAFNQPLEENDIVKIAIETTYKDPVEGESRDYDYSWAFQVADTFKITGTLPGDKATGVPTNSGIEIRFSHNNINLEELKKHFQITPEVKGSFESHYRTMAFVPEQLQTATLYTVTLTKGLPLQGSDKTIEQDFTFQFETQSSPAPSDRNLTFSSKLYEFAQKDNPAFGVYYYDNEHDYNLQNLPNPKYPVAVYEYDGLESFKNALKQYTRIPNWAYGTRENFTLNPTGLKKIYSGEVELWNKEYSWFFMLPDKLSWGYYLVETDVSGKKSQAWFQITDITSYSAYSQKQSLVWVHDASTGNPVANATIKVESSGETFDADAQGLAKFETPESLKNNQTEEFVEISSSPSGQILLTMVAPTTTDHGSNYWQYLYLDREIYKPNDTVKIWGFLKHREKPRAEKAVLRLEEGGYWGLDSWSNSESKKPIAEKEIEIGKNTFINEFKLENLAPGTYTMAVYINEQLVIQRYFSVETYTKPAYELNLQADKKGYFKGEKAVFEASSSFFDGTPVSNSTFVAMENWGNEQPFTTDQLGKAKLTYQLNPQIQCDSRYCPLYQSWNIGVRPQLSEEGQISVESNVYVFQSTVGMNVKSETLLDTQAKITVSAYNVNLERFNASDKPFYYEETYQGDKAVGKKVSGEIIKQEWIKIETGKTYDFISKKVVPNYRYEMKETPIGNFNGVTDQKGELSHTFTIDPDKFYLVALKVFDNQGNYVGETTSILRQMSFPGSEYYELFEQDAPEHGHDINDQVSFVFNKGNQQLPDGGQYLYFRSASGIHDFETSQKSTYQFTYGEQDVPWSRVNGIYFDGSRYHIANHTSVSYNRNLKELKIQVQPDKNEYKPGEKVQLAMNATDKDGTPVKTDINLNLVDEAFYKLVWFDSPPNPLETLYSSFHGNSIVKEYVTHRYPEAMMEGDGKGGCFTADTQILMADGSTKAIKDVRIGDKILTKENKVSPQLVETDVIQTVKHRVHHYLKINNLLEVTPVHVMWVNDQWKTAAEIRLGDRLLDKNGKIVIVASIESINKAVEVYNLEIAKQHTYFAQGIYVHNNKGGEPRQDFPDTALFEVVRTDASGQAQISFELPDNVTSWRVSAQAINSNLQAGASAGNVIVSLPLFVDSVNAKEYLVSDKPIIKIRAWGKELKPEDQINFEVKVGENLQKIEGKAYQSNQVALPPLTQGTHKLEVSAQKGQLKDQILEEFNMVSSRLTKPQMWSEKITPNTKVTGNQNGRTELTITGTGRGELYQVLLSLHSVEGERIDQRLSKIVATQLLNQHFGTNMPMPEAELTLYQKQNGGIALLPYSEAEIELSALAARYSKEVFDMRKLTDYFYSVLDNKKSNPEEIILALYGLAMLDEPVLTSLQTINDDWMSKSWMSDVYLALALEKLGDGQRSRQIFEDLITQTETQNRYIILWSANLESEEKHYSKDVAVRQTALLAALASALQDERSHKMWSFVTENTPDDTLIYFEQLAYAQNQIENTPAQKVSFTLTLGDRVFKETLENGKLFQINLSSSELTSATFSDVQGELLATTSFDRPVQPSELKTDPRLEISREYYVNGNPTTTFKEGDLVQIRIYPFIDGQLKVFEDNYLVRDLLPSGMVPITSNNPSIYYVDFSYNSCSYAMIHNVKNQEVNLYFDRQWMCELDYVFYYARIINQGQFIAEPATISSVNNPGIMNISESTQVVITEK